MKKRLFIGLAVLAVAICAVLMVTWRGSAGVYYHGKSLDAWSLQATTGSPEAKAALKAMGSNAVPGLIELIQLRDSPLRRRAFAWVRRLPPRLRAKLAGKLDPAEITGSRWAAARAFGVIGPEARSGIPALAQALHDSDYQLSVWAVGSLCQIGKDSVPTLMEALHDSRPFMRRSSAFALGELGSDAQPAVPALVELLADPDPDVQDAAAFTLKRIGTPAFPALTQVIEHGNTKAQVAAVQTLLQFDSSIRSAGRALEKMARSDSPVSRRQAIETLGSLRPVVPAFRALTGALHDPVADVRLAAIKAFRNLPALGQRAVPDLAACLDDASANVREEAARTLGLLGPPAQAAIPKLTTALADKEPSVSAAAKEALANIDHR